MEENEVVERLEATAMQLEKTLAWLEERQGMLSGEVERISATVEQTRREAELQEKLAAAECELAEIKAAAAAQAGAAAQTAAAAQAGAVSQPAVAVRRTVPAATAEMLAKHGLGDGAVDVGALDAALAGLSLEQRIAVKTQLLRGKAAASY